MTIDLRILIPFVLPFILLGLTRALWWMAGAEWSDPGAAAAISMFGGFVGGAFLAGCLADQRIEIGKITIGAKK